MNLKNVLDSTPCEHSSGEITDKTAKRFAAVFSISA